MCESNEERIRINHILSVATGALREMNVLSFDHIVKSYVAALQSYYDDPSLAECIEAKARHSAALYLAICKRHEAPSPRLRVLANAA
jgi:hypothetical protein